MHSNPDGRVLHAVQFIEKFAQNGRGTKREVVSRRLNIALVRLVGAK
jgi:hypothetical protein